MRRPPALPPENVRLDYAGEIVPADCVYAGWDRAHRAHRWQVVTDRPGVNPSRVLIDRLPPHTSVLVPTYPEQS